MDVGGLVRMGVLVMVSVDDYLWSRNYKCVVGLQGICIVFVDQRYSIVGGVNVWIDIE